MKKALCFLLVVAVILIALPLQTHSHQEDTDVEYEEYDITQHYPHYTDWAVMESNNGFPFGGLHSGTPNITYKFDPATFPQLIDTEQGISVSTSKLQAAFENGAELWNNARFYNGSTYEEFSVVESSAATVTITVKAYWDSSGEAAAAYRSSEDVVAVSAALNHYENFTIYLNRYYLTPLSTGKVITCAHEIGHVFGLIDLDYYIYLYNTEHGNNTVPYMFSNVLMGYGRAAAVTGPTAADIKGAAVITGIHSNDEHVFSGRGLYHVNAAGSISTTQHRKICSLCDGYVLEGHSLSWRYHNETWHRSYCTSNCGYDSSAHLQIHTYAYESGGASQHSKACAGCTHQSYETHTMAYATVNAMIHSYHCEYCSYAVNQNHNFSTWINGGANHYKPCLDCTHTETADHIYGSWTGYNSSTHRKTCTVCGYYKSASHSYGGYVKLNDTHHKRTCAVCGYINTTPHAAMGRCG